LIVPPLRVGMHPVTLRVILQGLNARRVRDAERPGRRYHAERGNDRSSYLTERIFSVGAGCSQWDRLQPGSF